LAFVASCRNKVTRFDVTSDYIWNEAEYFTCNVQI
jgi:hypothetical protein